MWVEQNFVAIKELAETTTRAGRLRNIEHYAAARMRYLRFNYSTGDAAGQNMVNKATFVACDWIKENSPGIERYMLSGSMDTDKKHSALNTLHTRGKRVIAEAAIPEDLLESVMGVSGQALSNHRCSSTRP